MTPNENHVAEFLRRLGHRVTIVAKRPVKGPDKITVVWPAECNDPLDAICGLARDHHAVYVNLNPLTQEMLTTVPASNVSIRDVMIEQWTRVLIDIDGPPKNEARRQFDAIRAELGEPLIATDSGNGHALIYECNLPASSTRQVGTYLRQLKQRYSLVDTNVASLSRLTRVPGTFNRCKLTGERIPTLLL